MRITTWVFRRENKSLLTASTINNAVLPLNRYGFFRFLNEKLIPNGKISIDVTLETDNNVIFRANGVDPRRYVVTRMVLWVSKVIFNTEGETMLLETFSKPHSWSYLRERIVVSPSSTSRQRTFKIDSNIRKPRHVFVLVLNETKLNDQEQNMFLFNTYNITNNRTITSCQLELSNGVYYPQERLEPTTQLAKTYRTLLGYNQGFVSHVTSPSIDMDTFKDLYGLIYFNLTNQEEEMKTGSTKIDFRYTLSNTPNAAHLIYTLLLYEEEVSVNVVNGKVVLQAT